MRWVTYLPEIQPLHLTKDVGLIPYFMGTHHGCESTLVGKVHFDPETVSALDTEVAGLQLHALPETGNTGFLDKAFLEYLDTHGKSIDVLNLYHLSRHTLIYGLKYKRKNPKGKLYLKMDAYNQHLLPVRTYSKHLIKDVFFQILERRFLKQVDWISVENRKGLELMKANFKGIENKLGYMPNGCNDALMKTIPEETPEKVILSVGRIGGADKNYDLLIRALPFLKLDGWKMKVIGPVEPAFASKWKKAMTQHPELTDSIEFSGAIFDRQELYREYSRASVFFLPSRFESFGISFVEAQFFGAVLVGHKGMSAFADIVGEGNYGVFYEDNDPHSFAKSISTAMAMSEKVPREEIAEYNQAHFHWSRLTKNLLNDIKRA